MSDSDNRAKLVELGQSPYAIYEYFVEKGWTDGLPIIPPTEDLIVDMLRYTDRERDEVIADIPPNGGAATVEKIAINAVMAGCRPEYLPVIIAAIEAVVVPEYNLYGRQTTTHPGAHLVIVHGPIRNELDINCRQNVFGQGWRANATIGRAVRLIMTNIGGGIPGITDMATHGHPGKYSYCIGEDEEGCPWPTFHADRGFDASTSAVTVYCAESPHNVNDLVSKTPQRYLGSAASTMSHLGANGPYRGLMESEQMLVMTAESAQWLHGHDWDKDDVQGFLYDNAQNRVGDLRDRGGWGHMPMPDFVDMENDDDLSPIVPLPENILIVVAGGHGRHMQAVLSSSYTMSITKPIALKDGTPIQSVQDFLK